MTFDYWESEEYLSHYGMPGMKWGVRRYLNKDGTLTELGKKRYGDSGQGASARKMQRDFNKLDKSYAHLAAEKHQNVHNAVRADYFGRKRVKKLKSGGYSDEQIRKDKKTDKLARKVSGQLVQAVERYKGMKRIEDLQKSILKTAINKGYTVTSKPVIRLAATGKTKAALLFGGLIGYSAYSAAKEESNTSLVPGSKAKIRKKGDKKTKVWVYDSSGSIHP